MPAAAKPVDEADRRRALRRLAVLDTEREDQYDTLVALAATRTSDAVGRPSSGALRAPKSLRRSARLV